jgi:hypothetical protein
MEIGSKHVHQVLVEKAINDPSIYCLIIGIDRQSTGKLTKKNTV